MRLETRRKSAFLSNRPVGWAKARFSKYSEACKISRAVPTRSVFRVGKIATDTAYAVLARERFCPRYGADAILLIPRPAGR